MDKKYTCYLCKKEFVGYGNNPWPLVNDITSRCCDECNFYKIIPARILKMKEKEERK